MKLFCFVRVVPHVEPALGAGCSQEEEEKVKANFRPLACEAQTWHQFFVPSESIPSSKAMKKVSTKLTSSTRHFQFEPLHALLRKGLWGLALACFTDAILKQKGTHRSPRNGMLLATKMR